MRYGRLLLLVLLLSDLAFSFWQYLQFPLDGDLAPIVGPTDSYAPVLHDPFGLRALLHQEVYAAPNRFFAHFFQFEYFRHVPLWLQVFLTPIDSLYAACGLLRLVCHGLLVFGLAAAVSNRNHVLNRRFLLAAVLVTPLLQASGYYGQMGVVDQSISYTCAYALPQSLLLLFFLPFLQAALHGTCPRLSAPGYASLAALAVVLAFNGPTVAATALLACPLAVLALWQHRLAGQPRELPFGQRAARAVRALPPGPVALFAWLALLSLYSVYIGSFNSENLWTSLPLAERYARLSLGVVYQIVGSEAVTGDYRLAGRFGLPLLLTFLLVNAWYISRRLPATQSRRVRVALRWLGLFALVYLLLLPLGGYREYRHYLVRRDTVLPILIGLMGCFALSTYFLLGWLRGAARWRYVGAVVVLLVVFTIADKHRLSNTNACERQLLAQLAAAPGPIVRLPATCSMMDWQPLTDYHNSVLKGQLLAYWGITQNPKLYYQQ